jgi:intracellular septation protein A
MSNEIRFFFWQYVTCDLQSTTCKIVMQSHIVHHVDACEVQRGEYNAILTILCTFFIVIVTKMTHPQNFLKIQMRV